MIFNHICQNDEEHKNIPSVLQYPADKNKHTLVLLYLWRPKIHGQFQLLLSSVIYF